MDYIDEINLSLQGLLTKEASIPWVENAFAAGSFCEGEYRRMCEAYERLCGRLGVDMDDEDEDLNIMVDAMENIQEVLCREIFKLGIQWGTSRGDR